MSEHLHVVEPKTVPDTREATPVHITLSVSQLAAVIALIGLGAMSIECEPCRNALRALHEDLLVVGKHSFTPGGPPVLFETMVFGGALDQECERYSTADAAIAGHEAMVERVATLIAAQAKDATKQ